MQTSKDSKQTKKKSKQTNKKSKQTNEKSKQTAKRSHIMQLAKLKAITKEKMETGPQNVKGQCLKRTKKLKTTGRRDDIK